MQLQVRLVASTSRDYSVSLCAKPEIQGKFRREAMRILLITLCCFLCVSAVSAQSETGQESKIAERATNTESVSKVSQIATEEDLLAYQAMINIKKPRINLSLPDVAAQVANIERHIKEGITFSELSGGDLRKVHASLKTFAKMSKKLDDTTSASEITPQLLAEQDTLNSILNKAQMDSVFECYSTQTTGSHFIVRKCRTVAQLRRMRERDQDGFRRRVENKLDAPRNGSGGQNGASFGEGQ